MIVMLLLFRRTFDREARVHTATGTDTALRRIKHVPENGGMLKDGRLWGLSGMRRVRYLT